MFTSSSSPSQSDLHRPAGAFLILGFVWTISLLVLISPLASNLALKVFFLAVPVGLSIFVTISRPRDGFVIWAFGVSLLATQTGFQLDIGPYRTSALELAIVFLISLIFLLRHRGTSIPLAHYPGRRLFVFFATYASVMLVFSLILDTPLSVALSQFKGFLFYPLLGYILVAGLRSRRSLDWLVMILAGWYLAVGLNGIYQFAVNQGQEIFFRTSAGYAPSNIFGVTVAIIAVLLIGINSHQSPLRMPRWLGYLVALVLIAAAVTSLSRTAVIALVAGFLFLFLQRRIRHGYLLLIPIALAVITLVILPDDIFTYRIFQLTDSSSTRRFSYLYSGVQAWRANWLVGWGWGRSFVATGAAPSNMVDFWHSLWNDVSLVSRHAQPWYHNDYLNLAVQIGLVGLLLYLAFWQQVFARTRRWLREFPDSPLVGYVQGSAAALFAFLVGANFDHLLWRPDAAGIVGLLLGLLLVSMRLGESEVNG